MFKKLFKKELRSANAKFKKGYHIEKFDEPIELVTIFSAPKNFDPNSLSSYRSTTDKGYVFKSSELYHKTNKAGVIVDEGFYKDGTKFISKSLTRETIPCKDFGKAQDNIVLRSSFNKSSNKLRDIKANDVFLIRYKFKMSNSIIYSVIYKGETGFIIDSNSINELNQISPGESYLIREELKLWAQRIGLAY